MPFSRAGQPGIFSDTGVLSTVSSTTPAGATGLGWFGGRASVPQTIRGVALHAGGELDPSGPHDSPGGRRLSEHERGSTVGRDPQTNAGDHATRHPGGGGITPPLACQGPSLQGRLSSPRETPRGRAFTRARVAVFVDGCFWHGCPMSRNAAEENAQWWRQKIDANRKRDRDTDERLAAEGWCVLRFWEHEDSHPAADRVAMQVFRRMAGRAPRRHLKRD